MTTRRGPAHLLALILGLVAMGALAPGATAATANCGGVSIAKSTGGYWQCSFDDEFSASSLDTSKWTPQLTATSSYTSGPTACFVNTPNNIAQSGGYLKLTARKEPAPFTCKDPAGDFRTQYTSGMVSTYGRFGQAYGRFEVRASLPSTAIPGLQESLWLWPVNPFKYGYWPASGEIDFAEAYSQYADRVIPFIHYNAATYDPNVTNNYCMISDLGAFHTYAVEWTTSTIKIVYDGKTCLIDSWNPASLVKPQPFDQPFIIALTQALGIGTNAFDPARTPLPATSKLDYVRVWK